MKIALTLCSLGFAGLALATPGLVLAPDSTQATDTTEAETDCCATPSGLPNVYVQAPATKEVTGKAHGRVVFEGKLPAISELSITEAQSKGCMGEGKRVSTRNLSLLIGKERGIANAVVSIALSGQELILPKKPVVLDQAQCRFDQHVVVVPKGSTVEYKNSDSVVHNVHTYSVRNESFNRALAPDTSIEKEVHRAEAIRIRCDMHPWMSAYLFVTDTNYVALTDEHGAFSIAGLPPGDYTANVWHEKLGKTEVRVHVDKEGKSEPLSVSMKQKKKRTRRKR